MSFKFDNINCESLGMFVERYPSRPIPQRKQSIYSIAGRSGDLIVDENAYTNVVQEYEVFVKDGATSLQSRLSAIAAWLVGKAGYLRLEDSYDTTIYRKARVANAVEFLNSLNKFGKGTIQFDCQPQRFPVTDEVYTKIFGDTLETITYANSLELLPAYPLIEITGKQTSASPRIVAGGLTVSIVTPQAMNKVVIDFETQSVYNAFNNTRPALTSVFGTWDMLGNGDTITAVNESTNTSMTLTVYTRRYKI